MKCCELPYLAGHEMLSKRFSSYINLLITAKASLHFIYDSNERLAALDGTYYFIVI